MNPNLRKKIIILSILLHILFFVLWEWGWKWDLFKPEIPPKPPEQQPLVFEFEPPKQAQKPKQVIETPDDAKTVEEQTKGKYLSDKNALARNKESDPKLKVDEAFSRGDLDTHELPRPQVPPGVQPQPKPQPKTEDEQDKNKEEKEEKEEIKEEQKPDPEDGNITIQKPRKKIPKSNPLETPPPLPPGADPQLPIIRHDQRRSRAEDTGGLSFNTYNWDYAPYMLMLKHRISRNIFPPPAFTKLGMIDGQTLLRFRIYPDGRLTNLQIIKYQGHKSLVITSTNAVEVSAPFPQLPSDFPEPYLEVTGRFQYFVKRQAYRR